MARTVNFVLQGKTALLMHKDSVEQADMLKRVREKLPKEISIKGDDRSPPWTWTTYLCHDGGHLCIPSDYLSTCLRQAGAGVVIPGGKRGKTFKEATQSGIAFFDEFLTFKVKGKQIPVGFVQDLVELGDSFELFPQHQSMANTLGFELYVKRAKVSGSKHVRVRPCFKSWTVCGSFQVTDDILTQDALGDIFKEAGKKGLGDWRPGCKTPGPYGQYEAILS